MKYYIGLFFLLLFAFVSCEPEEEGNPLPAEFSVTKGMAAGSIYVDFTKDPNVGSVLVERREKGTDMWIPITGTGSPFYDTHFYGTTGMPPGKVFEYRIKNDWPDDAPYSDIDEGWAYDIIPITEINIEQYNTANMLTWNAGNHHSQMNRDQTELIFDVYRTDQLGGEFEKIAEVGEDRSYMDDFTYNADLQGKTLYYRVDVRYYPFTATAEGNVVEAGGGGSGGNPTVDYTISDLGSTWTAAADGAVDQVRMKNYGGTIYAGALNNVMATGYGDPSLVQLSGDSWQPVWNTDPGMRFDKTSFAVSSAASYVGGVDDSLCVYAYEQGQWSGNLCPDNLGQADSPADMDLEVLNDALYMAITQAPEYKLQVLRLSGDSWSPVGGDAGGYLTATQVSGLQLDLLGGSLYLSYRDGDIWHIKHLEAGTWVDDLSWTQSDVAFTRLAMSGSKLYLLAGGAVASYRGGIYEVSSGSLTTLASNDAQEWFQFPLAMTADTDGNLVVSSMNIESAEVIHPFLSLYDGSQWKTMSGDFSGGIDPVGLASSGTVIYYLHGDAGSLNALEEPQVIKTMKLAPQ